MTRRATFAAALAIAAAAAIVLLAMGRPPICTCGHVELWHGAIDGGNSQHLADWYSPSHVIHGLIFYAAGHLLLRRRAMSIRFLVALGIEAAWEIAENTPLVIDRYRATTAALGYTGDSVLNSLSDMACMAIGFAIAARAPRGVSIAIGIALELIALAAIRDNLTLNVLMLLWPVAAVGRWQAG